MDLRMAGVAHRDVLYIVRWVAVPENFVVGRDEIGRADPRYSRQQVPRGIEKECVTERLRRRRRGGVSEHV